MKVILSIDPIRSPLTGIGRYTFELAKGLQKHDFEDLLFLRGFHNSRKLNDFLEEDKGKKRPFLREIARKTPVLVDLYQAYRNITKSASLLALKDYIYHGPNYFVPYFRGKSVVTIHDLSVFLWPESHPKDRVRMVQREIQSALRYASAIITDAEYTRQEVADYFSWPVEKIHAIPLGMSGEFRPRSACETQTVMREFGLEHNSYTLFLGTIEPRKNVDTLIEAYARLPQSLRQRYPLVLSGFSGWKSEAIHEKMERYQKEGWLRYLGFAPSVSVPILLSACRLFCYPSLYEGFGLPVLEAMASGVPVICSNSSTLPEVAGNTALFHDALDQDALLELLRYALENPDMADRLKLLSLARSTQFTWDSCIDKTIAVYRKVADA